MVVLPKTRGLDVFSASVPEVIEFFAASFRRGASSATINSHCAALSKSWGQDVYSLKPTLPKYSHTWDPEVDLDHMKNMPDTSLQDLSYKLVTSLALATGQRIQTLASIVLDNIVRLEIGVEIIITKRLKTSGKDRTKEIRKSESALFITFKKPFHAASCQTLSRWIKIVLSRSGYATTAAARKGISYDVIRLGAGWTQKSEVFGKFYKRPVRERHTFASLVLDS
nr:unnamed protein product [Callosobruchus analis]